MDTSTSFSTDNGARTDERRWAVLGQAIDQLTHLAAPARVWSASLLAHAERRAAKGLWSAAAGLGRAAHHLDAAGRAMQSRAARQSQAPISVGPDTVPAGDGDAEGPFDDEICAPHLA